jgi:hypothetical protein
MPVYAKIDYTATASINPPIGETMDSLRISADVSGKPRMGFTFFVVCLCVVAVALGLIDLRTGHHRLTPTSGCAASACYLANRLWPSRWWSIIGVPSAIVAIVSFFIK